MLGPYANSSEFLDLQLLSGIGWAALDLTTKVLAKCPTIKANGGIQHLFFLSPKYANSSFRDCLFFYSARINNPRAKTRWALSNITLYWYYIYLSSS